MEIIFRFGKDRVKQKKIDELTEENKQLKEKLKQAKLDVEKENLFNAGLIEKEVEKNG